jgi:integrase
MRRGSALSRWSRNPGPLLPPAAKGGAWPGGAEGPSAQTPDTTTKWCRSIPNSAGRGSRSGDASCPSRVCLPSPANPHRGTRRCTPSSPRRAAARDLAAPSQLLAVVLDSVRGRRDRATLLTLVLTGRRRSEVINLTAGDITVEGDTAFYSYRGTGVKTGRRELPRPAYEAVCATVSDAGMSLGSMSPSESIWQAGATSAGITSGTFYGRFRRYLRAAGLAPTGLHILRHTAAKLRREAGESIEPVSSFLDHSSLAVTTVYLRRLEGIEDRTWADVARAVGV